MRKERWLAWIAAPVLAGSCALAFYPAKAALPVNAGLVAMNAAAKSTAPPVAGVQDSWINSCDRDPYMALLPGQVDNAHKHPVKVTVKGKTGTKKVTRMVPYADRSVPAVDSPYWAPLDMNTVRFSPTWDIVYQGLTGKDATAVSIERTCFNYWLGQLAAKGISAEIAFKPDYCYMNPVGCPDTVKGHVVIPTLSRYAAAMSAFIATYPQIKIIAPWGEPDFQPKSKPKFAIGHRGGANFGKASCSPKPTVNNCGPMLAAQMWVAVRRLCLSCTTVIAGDFGGNAGQDARYFPPYQKYLRNMRGGHHYHPAVWGIHPYGDMETAERQIKDTGRVLTPLGETLVAKFSSWLKADRYGASTHIWLDEISSFTRSSKTSHCRKHNDCFSTKVQAKGGRYLFNKLAIAPSGTEPRVMRIYYLRFAGNTADSLINGKPRRIYSVVVHRPKPQEPTTDPAPSPGPTATSSPVTATRFEIRNIADNLCLDANDRGPTAGKNGDKVQLWACYGGANQKWIPQYKSGQLASLVNAKYPGMCLNADNTGGLANGRRIQLWNCYYTANELWNVGTLLANPVSSPLIMGSGGSGSLALDADKFNLGNGDKVQVWAYYGASNQLWYPDPA